MTTTPVSTLPPLENGDVMSSEEFWRRYQLRHDIKKAEHINGVVYVPSPTYLPHHSRPHGIMATWLGNYAVPRDIILSDGGGTVILPTGNTVEPDVALFREREDLVIPDRGPVEGAPDLVVEISASTTSYDLHQKKDAYEAAGVKEYVVWRTYDRAVDWFRLVDDAFERVEPVEGRVESAVFPGLVLDIAALLEGDYAKVLAAVNTAQS